MINYHNKTFRSLSNSSNGEVGSETFFYYQQHDYIVTAHYSGGNIIKGQLIAIVNEAGHLNMRYQHVNTDGKLMTGICHSIPEILPNGKLRLYENWQWTSGDQSSGTSIIEEV